MCLDAAARGQPPDFEHAALLAPGTPAEYRGFFMHPDLFTSGEGGAGQGDKGRRHVGKEIKCLQTYSGVEIHTATVSGHWVKTGQQRK